MRILYFILYFGIGTSLATALFMTSRTNSNGAVHVAFALAVLGFVICGVQLCVAAARRELRGASDGGR